MDIQSPHHYGYPLLVDISNDFTLFHMCLTIPCHAVLELSSLTMLLYSPLGSCTCFDHMVGHLVLYCYIELIWFLGTYVHEWSNNYSA